MTLAEKAELEQLVVFGYCDLGGIIRGRSIPLRRLDASWRSGLGWVPANQAITALGAIAEPNAFGALDDLRIQPDRAARVVIESDGSNPRFDLVLCDAVNTDGTAWDGCPRNFMRGALERLHRELGATLVAALEHEFFLVGEGLRGGPFSLEAQRGCEPFASEVMQALAAAGLEPEAFLAEYGARQFEIPCAPSEGLAAADRGVLIKEVVRECARRRGRRASFAPQRVGSAIGNGAHVHLSLIDADGHPLLVDDLRQDRLGAVGSRFASGILAHAEALVALSASSPISYARLAPHRWSAGSVSLGERDREALLRVPPVIESAAAEPGRQLHLEFRAADATANPYLALGALIHAGLDGIEAQLEPPDSDRELPRSLSEALDALVADEAAIGWMPPLLAETFLTVKRAEAVAVAELDEEERLGRYGDVY